MKTRIVSTRIPAGQANGVFNISLPKGFGVPKGFVVYAMDNIVQPNNFDSDTDFPCISVGFGGSNIAGTGLTSVCVWVSNEENARPTNTLASFANTVSIFATNISGNIRRQWQLTGFDVDTILGTYQGVGTQQTPLDAVFTVFAGEDFTCAVGQTFMPNAINTATRVATTFQPDAILFSHIRPAQSTDGQIHFGTAIRDASTGSTNVTSQVGGMWKNDNGVNTTAVRCRISNAGSFNIATNAAVNFQYMFPTGFAVTQSTANTGNSIIFLAMKAGTGLSTNPTFAAGTFQSATGTGTSYYAVGFKPEHILGNFSHVQTLNTSSATVQNGAEMLSFFTANGFQKTNITGIGTFTSTTSSTTITGVGTSFLNQLGAIDTIYNKQYQLVGIVSSITSNTSLLLQSNAAVTATGSSFVFEKPQQFSFSYGNQTLNSNGNDNLRCRFSDNGIIGYVATGLGLSAVGNILNLNGENGFNVDYTTLVSTGGARFGWYLAIRDDDYYRRRRVITT